jgi:hypothetical protein
MLLNCALQIAKMTEEDAYQILGIQPGASAEEIALVLTAP